MFWSRLAEAVVVPRRTHAPISSPTRVWLATIPKLRPEDLPGSVSVRRCSKGLCLGQISIGYALGMMNEAKWAWWEL